MNESYGYFPGMASVLVPALARVARFARMTVVPLKDRSDNWRHGDEHIDEYETR
ncbi:hypothetical protein MESS2_280010 [Mesorhizobium metallidurans STM 2683]|uniref:Uncharacterized protein n=1 Tax=Mesorhizobium metallidurans STM 2683 TaxID=1297569 RepID=M5EPR8_9HYPH|nr:hypothetical protein MESS2_280010 [Mesorhizobium metallidurans STM 2683]